MKANIVQISPAELKAVFPLIHDHIMKGIEQSDGRYDVESFCRMVADGEWKLWGVYVDQDGRPAFKAVVASQLYEEPSGRLSATVPFTGGLDRHIWAVEVLAFLEGWAAAEGATRMQIIGRKGWARLLDDYKIKNVVLEKKLGKEDGQLPERHVADADDGQHATA